ncbi:glutathione S-transferase family protein [Brasilonema bromeliae]|uniref:Glutathione S-transferase n=1 Tax=Brasilonema bromeliae SPC951 TaxID=385972 RepID=A0ABX1PED6_9CYAN|nr:glutathione S-transferase family protein [Brasilonema bromeliae]NMG22147.1 glutathione S-transferase [Brasilonema bromeliae SPC951]
MTSLTLVIGNKNYSSWSLRPWLAMKQMGLEFTEIRIPLYQVGSSAQVRRYSPSGKVPVLLHDEITVWDSLAILEYLIEQFPALPWLPLAAKPRAIARSICAEMHSSFANLRQHMPMNIRAYVPGGEVPASVQADITRITTIWHECREAFGMGGNFLFGAFTIVDAMYAPVVTRFITYGVQLDSVCSTYAEAILALPAMQNWIAAAKHETETIESYTNPPN